MPILKSSTAAALRSGFFRQKFEDEATEAAWTRDRLEPLRKTNQIAAVFYLVILTTFTLLDLLYVQLGIWELALRAGLMLSGVLLLIYMRRTQNALAADRLAFGVLAITLPISWFGLFAVLPAEVVSTFWMITIALELIILFVVIDISLPFRLVLSGLVLVCGIPSGFASHMTAEDLAVAFIHLGFVFLGGWMAAWQVESKRRVAFANQRQLAEEKGRTESLLRNILPNPIADQLLSAPGTIAEKHDDVTVLFADLVGFTTLSERLDAERVVEFLDRIFSEFDKLCDQYGVEKIKTIGDAYMAAGSVPTQRGNHVQMVIELGLDMLEVLGRFSAETGDDCDLRIGVHCGPVVAGVIGRRKFIYDLWGDTVNVASRMESHGVPGRVQVSEEVTKRLGDGYVVEPRGLIQMKGKGPTSAFLVRRRETASVSHTEVTGEHPSRPAE